jgi:hypothetical protein
VRQRCVMDAASTLRTITPVATAKSELNLAVSVEARNVRIPVPSSFHILTSIQIGVFAARCESHVALNIWNIDVRLPAWFSP